MADIRELRVGGTINDRILFDWRFTASVPQAVAEFWLTQEFPNSVINSKGVTPSEEKISNWEIGFGVVVGTITSLPGEERLTLLNKLRQGFFLLESKETRPIPSSSDRN